MLSFNSFAAGFVVGFGSGIGFRALAENDFESVKEVLKTGVVISQKIGDALVDTFGRMREGIDDIRAQARAEKVKDVTFSMQAKRSSRAGAKGKTRKNRSQARRPEVLHA